MHRAFNVRRKSIIGLCLLAGCTQAFQVSSGTKPQGLPFYVKKMVYRQHTTYEHSWLRISLSVAPILAASKPSGPEQIGARTTLVRDVRNNDSNRIAIDNLQTMLASLPQGSVQPGQIRQAFAAIPRLSVDTLKMPPREMLRATSNFVEQIAVVDYSTKYYLNGKIPWFGSNNIAAELAPDGTLSKGSAAAVGGVGDAISGLLGALSGVLPIKEFLTAKWVPGKGDVAALDGGSRLQAFRFELTVDPLSMTFDFTRDRSSLFDGSVLLQVPPDFTSGVFVTRPGEKAVEKPAKDGNQLLRESPAPATEEAVEPDDQRDGRDAVLLSTATGGPLPPPYEPCGDARR